VPFIVVVASDPRQSTPRAPGAAARRGSDATEEFLERGPAPVGETKRRIEGSFRKRDARIDERREVAALRATRPPGTRLPMRPGTPSPIRRATRGPNSEKPNDILSTGVPRRRRADRGAREHPKRPGPTRRGGADGHDHRRRNQGAGARLRGDRELPHDAGRAGGGHRLGRPVPNPQPPLRRVHDAAGEGVVQTVPALGHRAPLGRHDPRRRRAPARGVEGRRRSTWARAPPG
jgi:hypothetical protein